MKSSAPGVSSPGRGLDTDLWLSRAVLAAGLVLRLLYTLHHRVNTDEPQHLHVAWAEAHGALVYRDVFDNHAPLFSALMAPLVRALGERADVVIWMRFAMLPMVALSLWAAWWIGRELFSSRAARWTVAIAAIAPDFLLGSVEYRADQLWAALWLASLLVLVSGRFTRARSLGFGLVLGACIGVSMKTALLLGSLVAAAGIVLLLLARRGAAPAPGWVAARGLWALSGLAVVPVGIAAYFAARGAWAPFVYNTVSHNVVPRLGLWSEAPWRPLAALPALPVIGYGAARLIDATHDRSRGVRRALVMAGGAIYFTVLNCFWPLVTRQDSLPLIPIAAVFAAPLLIAAGDWLRSRRRARIAVLVPVAACALEATVAFAMEPPWQDNTAEQRRFLGEVLRLTRPGESVMDLKGESIFRTRSYYYALEPITLARMNLGIIPDDIAQHLLIARPVAVTTDSDIYPAAARAFLEQNYVPVGQLRVTGRWLDPAPGDSGTPRRFDVAIPGTYVLVTGHGAARGRLDGSTYLGPRRLLSGSHVYLAAPDEGRVAVVWANAVVRGFSPFLASAREP